MTKFPENQRAKKRKESGYNGATKKESGLLLIALQWVPKDRTTN